MKDGFKLALAFVGIVALGFAIWGATVALSNLTGAGGAIIKKNSTGNRIEQQANFEDLVNEYNGNVQKIQIAKAAMKGDEAGTVQYNIDKTNLEGIEQTCIDTANEFNADSAKYLARQWKSAGLPLTLSTEDCTP